MSCVAIVIGNANDTHIPSLCRLTNTQCNLPKGNPTRVNPDSYHSTLGLSDKHDCVFYFGQHNFSAYAAGLLHQLRTFSESTAGLSHPCKTFLDSTADLSHRCKTFSDSTAGLSHPFWSLTTKQDLLDNTTGLLHPSSRLFT